jgi:hypothetical protein
MKLTITAIGKDGLIVAPKTKKNSSKIIPHLKHAILVPSDAYTKWERAAIRALVGEGIIKRGPPSVKGKPTYRVQAVKPIDYPVNCRALIYRDALRGDAVGFYQAVGDFLQLAGVVANDKFIVSWDGSRLLKDATRPRVELELERVGNASQGELFESGSVSDA